MRVAVLFILVAGPIMAASDVPVPSECTPEVNARLANLIHAAQSGPVDNVMVCGMATRNSRYVNGHHRFSVLAHTPNGDELIEVDSNDQLDGTVTAQKGDNIFAYGQAYFDNTHQFAAGIHDVHCSTHRGADNGWIVVNGVKHPATCGQ